MKIIGFAGSTSSKSINKLLVDYTLKRCKNQEVQLLDLNDYELPLYSADREANDGFPPAALRFVAKIQEADALIISTSEHNQMVTAAFKNLLDWCSRVNHKFMENKPVLLLSTSNGGYGAQNARGYAEKALPKFGAMIQDTFSLPNFKDKFEGEKITDETYKEELLAKLNVFTTP